MSRDFTWVPSEEQLASANIARLARSLGCSGYEELHRVSIDEPDRFWRAVVSRPRDPVRTRLGRRARRHPRNRVDDVVRRRSAQHRERVRPPVGVRDTRPRSGGVGAGRRRAALADVGRGLARGSPARRSAPRARHRRGRRCRHVPADGTRGCDRIACVRAHRGGAGADLLRIRRPGGVVAARRRGREARPHRRRLVPAREARADEGGARRGARRRPECRTRARLATSRRRLPDDDGTRLVVGRRRGRAAGGARGSRRRKRGAVPPCLHVRHDGQAEGCAARPGQLPPVDRARDRIPGGSPRRRSRPLRDRHGLDHGPVDRGRRHGLRRDGRVHGGCAGPTRTTACGRSSPTSA